MNLMVALNFNATPFIVHKVERQHAECSKSLKWNKERVKELETKLGSLKEVV